MKKRDIQHIILCLFAALLAVSCSTTKRLGEGEVLYTGVKKMKVESTSHEKIPSDVESAIKYPLSVKPNNPLLSPYVRTPLPIGLWIYNAFYTERQTGFRSWVFRTFGKKPVLISDVQPELRVGMVKDIMDNHGYFGGEATYEIRQKKNPKKAHINYNVRVPESWHYINIDYPAIQGTVTRSIDSLKPASKLRIGDRYDIDSLSAERIRITNTLRDNAYYYFRPDYIEYLADTTQRQRGVDLRMIMANGIPDAALKPYKIGDVNIKIYSSTGEGDADSIVYKGMNIWHQKPSKVRPKIFTRALTISPGQDARVSDINSTLTNLSKLGIFRYVTMDVTPLDSLKPADQALDMTLTMAMDMPMDAEIEADFATKSNSFIGPRAIFSINHKNIFKGGEVLSARLNGGYEWQTGNKSQINSSAINSYEIGLASSLTFPRLLAPGFIRRNNYDTRTSFHLGTTLMNRPKFFRMLSFNGHMSYDFHTSPRSSHNLTLFKMTYNRLLSTTADFDEMLKNPAIANSFRNQLIPAASYTYTWDKRVRSYHDRIVWQSTFTTAGNLLSGVSELFGDRAEGEKEIFGNLFSQFVKGTTEFKYFLSLGEKTTLAMRFMAGYAHPYGNSKNLGLPYTEQFSIGGANSIRAFTIRSLGPGSYRPDANNQYGYFDQSGDFKLEANVELRFPVVAGLQGAVFLDMGNIWLMKEDALRPGGKLNGKTFFKDVATGTGVGLRYDLTFLVIRADLGIGIHTPYENPGKKGYYNIGKFKEGLGFHLAIGYPF